MKNPTLPLKEERMEKVNHVFKLLMEDVGERWIKVALINPNSGRYRGIAVSTWADLKSQHLIHDANAGWVILSDSGWEAGLRLAYRDNPEALEKIERIYKSIKSMSGESSLDAVIPVRLGKVASHSGLPAGFVANVIEARLIESWLKKRGVSWVSGFEGRIILVPLDFGLELT